MRHTFRGVADVGGGEGQPECVRSAGAANSVRGGEGFGGGGLEGRDLGAEDEALGVARVGDSLHDLVADDRELAGEIEHRDGLAGGDCRSVGHLDMVQLIWPRMKWVARYGPCGVGAMQKCILA